MSTTTEPAPVRRSAIGKVTEQQSRKGIDGAVVTLFHLPDATATVARDRLDLLTQSATRLGSVITSADGSFVIDYSASDVGVRTRNLVLTVAAPEGDEASDGAPMYVSRVRPTAGELESFSVSIPRDRLTDHVLAPTPSASTRLADYKAAWETEEQLAAEIAGFHKAAVDEDVEARKAFREELIGLVATDLAGAGLPGLVAEDKDIADKVDAVATSSVGDANTVIADARGVPVNLYLTQADRTRLDPFFQNATDGFALIPEHELTDIMFRTRNSENPGTLLIHQNPIARACAEHTVEEICAREHTGIADGGGAEPDGGDGTPPTIQPLTNELVPQYAAQILGADLGAGVSTAQRLDRDGVEASVADFSLRAGPADVPAYYDFQSLQIAFDHVWKILIDEQMVDSARAFEKRYKQRTGLQIAARFSSHWIGAINDMVYDGVPREVPVEVLAHFDITLPEWTDLNATYQARLKEIAAELDDACTVTINTGFGWGFGGGGERTFSRFGTLACEKRRQDLREQGERIIDSVRHDDYHTLHKTLRDLQERIESSYEFTVFAASKTSATVNFGLLNDYRQEWVPINYQVGELVKTIPLSPKEELRYSMKVSRQLEHVQNEAVKNNSSVTAEQSSTSRVEAEIMAKAQTNTDFGLNASGTYNVGLSKGKSKTTFGVEAQQESSSVRKDFREAVLKAAQEYKDERSIQIDTKTTDSSEYTESGVIVNPNDELSVTYLFYELQRRYRVSESIHRVRPVVLVAQEVPAPHQITEAWVLAHDWIINRALLDDSFRPTLNYLRTKSVGDDFALRELRKNLRQQRNLVESLRIEFAAASQRADSRYGALEAAIEDRIGEEEAEETDGWFSDVGNFFGGGGQSPEAAKARELAAKDAHQFAVERAEKQGAALKQEVGTLHQLTREYNDTLRDHLDNETRVKRLLVHLRKNIFHYMQAIWRMEPPDQRFMRLHKINVPTVSLAEIPDPQNPAVMIPDRRYFVQVTASEDIFAEFRPSGVQKHRAFMTGTMEKGQDPRPLVEVADLDNLLGFKGNYMIFPMKEHNALTEFMAAPYIDAAFGAMDPDELSNVSLQDYSRYVCCLHDSMGESEFEELKPTLKKWLQRLLRDPLRNGDDVVVPTQSLFIEALPGAHPLLEDFKLRHRELDVLRAHNDIRDGSLESLRLAARLVNSERDDPDVEKKIVVEGGVLAGIDVDND